MVEKGVWMRPRTSTRSVFGGGHKIKYFILKDNYGLGESNQVTLWKLAPEIHKSLHATGPTQTNSLMFKVPICYGAS